jgi:hypothetical protein
MVNILPKLFFVAGLYILSITPILRRASYSRCSCCFLIYSSQCLLILWKQLSPHILRNRLAENFSIWHQKDVDSTYNLPNDLFPVKQLYMGTYVFKICYSSQCLLILWKQLSPSNIQWSYWQLIEFWRFVYIMKLYGFGRFRPNMFFCTNSMFPFGTKKASIVHTIYRMIYFSWNNFTWVQMFSKYVKLWKYRVDLLMKLWF